MEKNLYRGKRKKDGQFVEGYYVFQDVEVGDKETHHFVLTHDQFGFSWHKVAPSTVGQYTGLKDKNGKRIFEGDIIQTAEYGRESSGKNYSGKDTFYVRYEHGNFCIENFTRRFSLKYNKKMEIIGNIHDNPELLDIADG